MKKFDPSTAIHDYLVFGEFGDVNPSITDSSTFTFLSTKTMEDTFPSSTINNIYLVKVPVDNELFYKNEHFKKIWEINFY